MGAKAGAKQWGHGWDFTFLGEKWEMGQNWRAESANVTNSPGAPSYQIDLWCSLDFLLRLIVIGQETMTMTTQKTVITSLPNCSSPVYVISRAG